MKTLCKCDLCTWFYKLEVLGKLGCLDPHIENWSTSVPDFELWDSVDLTKDEVDPNYQFLRLLYNDVKAGYPSDRFMKVLVEYSKHVEWNFKFTPSYTHMTQLNLSCITQRGLIAHCLHAVTVMIDKKFGADPMYCEKMRGRLPEYRQYIEDRFNKWRCT